MDFSSLVSRAYSYKSILMMVYESLFFLFFLLLIFHYELCIHSGLCTLDIN